MTTERRQAYLDRYAKEPPLYRTHTVIKDKGSALKRVRRGSGRKHLTFYGKVFV